jgi:hypothetical protein
MFSLACAPILFFFLVGWLICMDHGSGSGGGLLFGLLFLSALVHRAPFPGRLDFGLFFFGRLCSPASYPGPAENRDHRPSW